MTVPVSPSRGIVLPAALEASIAVGVPLTSNVEVTSEPVTSKQRSKIAVPSATVVPSTKSSVNHENVMFPALGLPMLEAFKFAKFKF